MDTGSGLVPGELFLGKGEKRLKLEVVVFSAESKPSTDTMHHAHSIRRGGRAAPILVVALHDMGASLCGTNGTKPPVYYADDIKQAEGLCKSALSQPDRNAAIRFLSDTMPSLGTALHGISNEGLLSLHELTHGTRNRPDWNNACKQSEPIRNKSGKEILSKLGFNVEPLDNLTALLTTAIADAERVAVAVLLRDDEVPEASNDRFGTSPVSYALTKADREKLPWVLIVQQDRVRLYNTRNVGVGRRGRTETYIECQPSLLSSDNMGLLWLLFSAEALKDGGTITDILDNSKRFAEDVAKELRKRIYDTVVPKLAMGIADACADNDDLDLTYQMALMVLFRLLFIAYAEDRDLLPYKGNEAYKKRSLKQKAIELAEVAATNQEISKGDHHWKETVLLWKAISRGNTEWGIPAYNGTMFSSKRKESPVGAELAKITLPNTVFVEVLQNLLLTSTDDNAAPVDFRSLSVREFGTIYEGLLESELSKAEQNLVINNKDTYLPAGKSKKIAIRKGEIYLHDRSGARKSSGSYYTPDPVVEHLLDGALEPALDEHLEKLKKLDDADLSEQFFDFKVADIAMGSGHFLVAAVDRIERRLALWLAENHTRSNSITNELQKLRQAANKALGELADQVEIEDGQLLRRMIARRCIYGVDLNPLAVQLAQLSIWIHTFVPGLPLSLLDHNLVHGNALVGVGSLDEIRNKLNMGEGTLFEVDPDKLLGKAAEPLRKLARLSDASVKDIDTGRKLMEEARQKTMETKTLCDLITASPVAEDQQLKGFPFEDWDKQKTSTKNRRVIKLARETLEPLSALHFPIAFPEVFLGQSQGFDVILGNPPWEEATVDEDKFWARHEPGLAGLSPREQEELKDHLRSQRPRLVRELNREQVAAKLTRDFLHAGNFPGMGTGDPDLYKAFAWRFWFTSAKDYGKIGVVLPRSAISAEGSKKFRRKLFEAAGTMDITTLQNTGKWVFNIHPQYTIALVTISRNTVRGSPGISLKGPFTSEDSFMKGRLTEPCCFTTKEVLGWNESASLPLLPTPYSAEVFVQLRKAPSLNLNKPGQWRARPDRELDATNQKHLMDLKNKKCPKGFWTVYKGESFNLWNPDTGEYNAWGNPKTILPWLQKKRLKAHGRKQDSVHREFSREHVEDKTTLAPLRPRIAFRDVTNSIDYRTVIAALIPPKIFITNTGPVVMFPKGDKKDEAYLLGVLCSIVLDWYARRYVGLHVSFYIFNSLPIPRPKRSSPLWKRVVQLSGRLACSEDYFTQWAAEVGVECGKLTHDDKQDKIHELDAVVAHLYDLSERHLVHIFESYRHGWDYKDRLNEVLRHYQNWSKKLQ